MVRRALPSKALATAALAAAAAFGGCAYGTPAQITAAQQRARVTFVKDHGDFSDRQLAQLCPGLYPARFLKDTKKYPLAKKGKSEKAVTVTAADRAQAVAAGCNVAE
jgi:hypothetical protein